MRQIPIETVHLFPLLDKHLIDLLGSLRAEGWNRPTVARLWTVKDVAAHLLDSNIRAVSMYRDGFFGDPPSGIGSYADLVGFLDALNADWVKAMRRVSPAVLTDLLLSTGKEYYDQLATLDPLANAIFPVAWAGQDVSENWFHIAREYTEKFHHQMQIREAVGQTEPLMSRELFYPFISTLLMGLPHTYRDLQAKDGSCIEIAIPGEAGGHWFVVKGNNGWSVNTNAQDQLVQATVTIPPGIAWKLFTKGLKATEASNVVTISGDADLGRIALTLIAVMG